MRLTVVFMWLAMPVWAQSPDQAARVAIAQLQNAQVALRSADASRDQIAALTETVQAYEAGLGALREGLRQVTAEEQVLTGDLTARRAELGQFLGVLSAISTTPQPALNVQSHRQIDAARAGMLVADVSAGLHAQAEALRIQLAQVQSLRALRDDAEQALQDGLAGVQDARAALGQAVSTRSDLPQPFADDPTQTALLLASTETLARFADGLSESLPAAGATLTPSGNLPLPVAGIVQPTQTGRDGFFIAAPPHALVTAPVAATILYAGPYREDGNVVILEPTAHVLFILSGMETSFGQVGQIVPAGTPLGLMGGDATAVNGILTENDANPDEVAMQTLYLEVRDGQSSVSPDAWFALE